MSKLTLTLKLPFYRLNACKAAEFERLTLLNTEVANTLLSVDKSVRRKYTSKDFHHIEIGSMWINQTIRNTCAQTKVKKFKRLPIEVNNQGYSVSRQGDLFTVSLSLYRGKKKRIPLTVHSASHQETLEKIINGDAANGSLKISKSRKGIWYALISVSMDVPEPGLVNGWIGVDRGQNNIAVAALPLSFGKFWSGKQVKSLRRKFQKLRTELQESKKLRKVKEIERHEHKIMTHINHVISKQLVQFAKDYNMGLRFEDLSGIRQTSLQRRKNKSDASKNRDHWAFYQLELFTRYKARVAGVPVESVPAPYTSKSDHRNGVIGKRVKHTFTGVDGYTCNADWNASQNIGQWLGFSCPFNLQKAVSVMDMVDLKVGVNDSPSTNEK
ncbi:MAG: IS200/IS605 family element transposase accessory protein TnpB [Okeania sp. SIO3B5]|uniref:transposase n=1 Tax=Okeania sp. SIO3B5 TaxID=2607811 RepID=UPI001400D42B|nr:transposase [Okeania sp. SIO3B5]NEO58542.1 IS200/IS605 family element transposase accessory protein TnpB [Okeania sp. SIO3B5]